MHHKLAFIGFGVVAQGLIDILLEKKKLLQDKYNFEYSVVAISDINKGSVYEEKGLDLIKIKSLIEQGKKLDKYPSGIKNLDSISTIKDTNADTIIEVTYTDVKTGEPALTHIKTAFECNKNVVSTNKGPVIKESLNLMKTAENKNLYYGFEGVVLAGTPCINLYQYTLAGNIIKEFKGILNGTTNYILTRMEEGMEYEDALKKAQKLGYAEADPTGDVKGFDTLGKVVILTNIVLGKNITWEDVKRKGITNIKKQDIENAKKEGKRWKLIGSSKINDDGTITARVWPEKISLNHPLSGISEATNALTFNTDELGDLGLTDAEEDAIVAFMKTLSDGYDINKMKKDGDNLQLIKKTASLRVEGPNPFNPSTKLGYYVPDDGYIQLEVFGITGEKVATLQSGFVSAGEHQVVFNAENLATGIYLVSLNTGKEVNTVKLILMK